MNVVVFAPHADDETLCCGGTIAKLVERGYDVFIYAFSPGLTHPQEFKRATEELGARQMVLDFKTRHFSESRQAILDFMVAVNLEKKPRMVFVPATSDVHQDHQVVTQEALRAFKHTTIYGYEASWNSYTFQNEGYCVLSPDHVGKKILALSNYKSQSERVYFKEDNILSTVRFRGMQAGSQYAECFQVIRQYL